jgi:bifunctional DNase/RNase
MVLKEKGKSKYMQWRIGIGPAEADAMVPDKHNVKVPRSLTYDLLCDVIAGYGGKVNAVVINDVHDDTIFAKLQITRSGHKFEVDCRPSDGIAVAIREKAPIFVESSVWDKCGSFPPDMPFPLPPPML